jgi:hypothetical protein
LIHDPITQERDAALHTADEAAQSAAQLKHTLITAQTTEVKELLRKLTDAEALSKATEEEATAAREREMMFSSFFHFF